MRHFTKLLFSFLLFSQFTLAQEDFSNWHWRSIGPSMPSGRAWTVIGSPHDSKTIFATTAGGGLWKSKNNGTTFYPVFDEQKVASTGAITMSLSNKNIVWCGSGEPANTRASSWGDGVYKSVDEGESWKNMGLKESYNITEIVIHPTNSNLVYVAAMGHLWGTNSQRGVFRTKDGGENWEKILYINDTTGINDLKIDPHNPNILYATSWQRFRYGGGDMDEAGPGSAIWKSTDAGDSWHKIMKGIPKEDLAKMSLAIGHKNSAILYVTVNSGEPSGWRKRESDKGGIFRSDDAGKNWKRVNQMQTSYFYQRIYTDPNDDETIWMPVLNLYKSTDGGKSIHEVNMKNVHYDLHSIWVDPKDSDHLILSGDGGVHISYDGGESWQQTILPIGQFYEVSVDNQQPYHVIGGMQETGLWLGPNATYDFEGITTSDWNKLRQVGDGMSSVTNPSDPNLIYMAVEWGRVSKLDLRNWKRTKMNPNRDSLKRQGIENVRYNWTTPLVLSKHDSSQLYIGGNHLFSVDIKTNEYKVLSKDLTWQQNRELKGSKDGYHSYGGIFSIAESPIQKNLLYVGSDDGWLWRSNDKGQSWEALHPNLPKGAPENCVISEIEASRFNANRAYITCDCHTKNDRSPYLFVTENQGKTWRELNSNLPKDHPLHEIKEDPRNENVLYCGTEFGIFVSLDRGNSWQSFNGNLPPAGIRSIAIQEREMDLVVATFGRGIWVTDILPIHALSKDKPQAPLVIIPPTPIVAYFPRQTYGTWIEELNGDNYFRGENPPYGTSIQYILAESNTDSVTIEIYKEEQLIRTMKGSSQKGLNQVQWDLMPEQFAKEKFSSYGTTLEDWMDERIVSPGIYEIKISITGHKVNSSIEISKESTITNEQVNPRR